MGKGKYLSTKFEHAEGITCEGVCLRTPMCQSNTIFFSFKSTEDDNFQVFMNNMVDWCKNWYGGWKNCIAIGECAPTSHLVYSRCDKKNIKIDLTARVNANDMKTSKAIYKDFINDLVLESQRQAKDLGLTFKSAKRKAVKNYEKYQLFTPSQNQ